MLHFGLFNVAAGLWRLAGVDARPLFRAPLAARSLADFWGRYLATRAAPDKARVRTPVRALYQFGVAPCFRRQCFLGWR